MTELPLNYYLVSISIYSDNKRPWNYMMNTRIKWYYLAQQAEEMGGFSNHNLWIAYNEQTLPGQRKSKHVRQGSPIWIIDTIWYLSEDRSTFPCRVLWLPATCVQYVRLIQTICDICIHYNDNFCVFYLKSHINFVLVWYIEVQMLGHLIAFPEKLR